MVFQFKEDEKEEFSFQESSGFSFSEDKTLLPEETEQEDLTIAPPSRLSFWGSFVKSAEDLSSWVLWIWEKTSEAFTAKDKFLRGTSSFWKSIKFASSATTKGINDLAYSAGLISDDTFRRVDEKYGWERTSSFDLLKEAKRSAWIWVFQTVWGAVETVSAPVSGVLWQGIENISNIEAGFRDSKKAEWAESVMWFVDFAEKEIGYDVLWILWYAPWSYSPQEQQDVWGATFDLVEALGVFKWGKALGTKPNSVPKDIEAMAESIITKDVEPEVNLKKEIAQLSENNNLTLNWYSDVAKRLNIDTTNIDNLIDKAADADNSLAFELYNKSKSTKLKAKDVEIKKLQKEGKDVKTIASETGLSKNYISEVVKTGKIKSLFSPAEDLLSLSKSSKSTLGNGKAEAWYDSTLDTKKTETVIRLEDEGLIKKVENNDGLYEFTPTAKGKALAEKEGVPLSSPLLNKSSYDSLYVRNSFNVKSDSFDKLASTAIKNDIAFWPREFARLKELAFKNELWQTSKALSDDIFSTIDTLNNRYNLNLDVKDLSDIDGNIDPNIMANVIKEIGKSAKKEFASVKNIKTQASKLVNMFDIESKLSNSDVRAPFDLSRWLKEVISMKNKFKNARRDATTKTEMEKAYILWENYRLKKLQVESRVDKPAAIKEYFLWEVKELARDTAYLWNSSEVFKQLNAPDFFDDPKAVSSAQKIIAEAQAEGLFKEVTKRVKALWESAKDVQMLWGVDNLLTNFLNGNASLGNLYELLLRMDEIKKTSTKELNSQRKQNEALAQTDLDKIREEWLTDLRGAEDVAVAGESSVIKNTFAKARQWLNELNFMMRILGTIGTKSKTFKDTFLFEVDGQYNKVQDYKDKVVDKIVIDIGEQFPTAKDRVAAGQYMMFFRKAVDADWIPDFEWFDKIKWDKKSWLNIKRSEKSLSTSMKNKPTKLNWMTDEMWEEVRNSKLWEVMEDGAKTWKYDNIQSTLWKEFAELKSDNDAITQLYDNAIIRPVENYLPLYERGGHRNNEWAWFDDPNFVSSKISDNHNQITTKAKLTYEYDIAKIASRGLMNQKYYNEMRPQYEKIKGIMYGKKINDTLYESPNMEGDEFMLNHEGGIASDMNSETQRILEIYLDRIRTGGDKFWTAWTFLNKAIWYINNQYLGFNPWTILKQPLWFFDSAWLVGVRNLGWATKASNEMANKALASSASLRGRFGWEISVKDLEDISTWKIGKGVNKFQKLSMEWIRAVDQFSATKVWMAAYRKFMKDNWLLKEWSELSEFNNPEAIEYSDILMQEAMSTVSPLFLPPAYRHALMRAVGQLMTSQLNRLGILFNDIPDLKAKGENKRAAIGLLWWTMSSIGDKAITAWMWYLGYKAWIYTWQGYDREYIDILIWEDSEERTKKLWEYMLSDMFWWAQAKAVFTWEDYLVIWWFVSQIAKDVMKVVEADDSDERIQWFFDLWWDAFGTWIGRRAADFYQNYNN